MFTKPIQSVPFIAYLESQFEHFTFARSLRETRTKKGYDVRGPVRSRRKTGWYAPATADDVIQSQQLKTVSEIIVKLVSKNKIEVSILGKATEPEYTPKADSLKDVMIQSMRDAGEIVAAVPDLGFRAEDAGAIGLSLFIART